MSFSAVAYCVLAAACCLIVSGLHAQERGDDHQVVPGASVTSQSLPDSSAIRPDPEPPSSRLAWHDAITNLPADWLQAGRLITNPRNTRTIVNLAILTGMLVIVDHDTYHGCEHAYQHSPFVRDFSDFTVHAGDGAVHMGVAAAFGLYGLAGSDHRALRTGSQVLEALLATGITVQVLKRVAGRESPESASSEGGMWRPFPSPARYQKNQPRYYAFPSGHIATTMATVTTIANNYPEAAWIRPVGYVVVAGVGFSLVNVRYHWYSDLPLGIALGYMFGNLISQRSDDGTSPDSSPSLHQLSVGPDFRFGGNGLTLSMTF